MQKEIEEAKKSQELFFQQKIEQLRVSCLRTYDTRMYNGVTASSERAWEEDGTC